MKTLIRLLVIAVSVVIHSMAQVPSTTPPKRVIGDGLRGNYYNGYAFNQPVRSQIDASINFFYDGHKSPVAGVRPQLFSVRWVGQLLAPVTGYYRFSSIADDGVRIWIGGLKVMEEWRERGRELFSRPAFLKAGQFYAIRVEYVNYYNGGFIDLDWEMPRKANYTAVGFVSNRTIIPTAYLFSDPAEMPRLPPQPSVREPAPVATVARPTVAPKKVVTKAVVPTVLKREQAPPVSDKPTPVASIPAKPVNPFDNLATVDPKTLDNVSFRQSSYELLPESYRELDQLADALKRSLALRIEISGHTDNVGDPRLNQTLSEYRAKVVSTYLIRRGIGEGRISIQGYGGSRPLVKNDSKGNRARNRRVEISVID